MRECWLFSRPGVWVAALTIAACSKSGRPRDAGNDSFGVKDGLVDGVTPPDGTRWGGRTIDEPYRTDTIKLVTSGEQDGFRYRLYRNTAYTCAKSGTQTFAVVQPADIPDDEEHPLWVRLHGGGTGAFIPDGTYQPAVFFPAMLDEEGLALAKLVAETGLLAKIRALTPKFRFMMPSMCDHDMYSGVGVPEPNNPYSPDENGQIRAADGLLATKAALAFTRQLVKTSRVFLHGTSAGSVGAFSTAYSLEREGFLVSGIIMDSYVLSPRMTELFAAFRVEPQRCVPWLAGLGGGSSGNDGGVPVGEQSPVWLKIGPLLDPGHRPDVVLNEERVHFPIIHIWVRGDPTFCGEAQVTIDSAGGTKTWGMADLFHEDFRVAIAAKNPGGASESLRMCVEPPDASDFPCAVHTPTTEHYNKGTPPGDLDHGGRDYNQYIADWVTARLAR